jgi:hypothetical protein
MILAAVAAEASAETFWGLMDHVAQGFEALGAAILVVGVRVQVRPAYSRASIAWASRSRST